MTDELNTLRAFVRDIAQMKKGGEPDTDNDGEPFVMENDDNCDTLCNLIEEARELTNRPVGLTGSPRCPA